MNDEPETLVLDLVEWVAKEARPYADVMDAWRTSCPRLAIWESAQDRKLVQRYRRDSGIVYVKATEMGHSALADAGRL